MDAAANDVLAQANAEIQRHKALCEARARSKCQAELPDTQPEAMSVESTSSDAADEAMPALFATSVPENGELTSEMSAIAAIIDEDEGHAVGGGGSGRKRKAASMGEVQVHMSLASCEGQQPAQRRRKEAHDSG